VHPIVHDLPSMPHLLVAGQTGSGKSVMINTILTSLLYRNSPSDLKLILVDPKTVEMAPYEDIPHLLTPVITEPEKCISALKWAVAEMERRYRTLGEAKKRNIG
jgi:S-DNA-T family DNA segregation ATPase FtsK/SpoIIIE